MRHGSVLLVVLSVFSMINHPKLVAAQTVESESARKVISKVEPTYPQMARTMKLIGVVRLEALVTPDGTAKTIQVKGGNPVLAQSAQSAVRAWKWVKSDHESTEVLEFHFTP